MKTSEIEFKAKNVDGEWVFGSYVEYKAFGEELRQIIVDRLGKQHWVNVDTLCQYIGRRDSEGVKVFEGDICTMAVYDTRYYQRPEKVELQGTICRGNTGVFYFNVLGEKKQYAINDSLKVVSSEFD